MKILNVTHKQISYEFRYLELSKVVEITKAGVFSYYMRRGSGLFYCNCPGSRYNQKCWHVGEVSNLMKVQSLPNWPVVQWAEEAGKEMYDSSRT